MKPVASIGQHIMLEKALSKAKIDLGKYAIISRV